MMLVLLLVLLLMLILLRVLTVTPSRAPRWSLHGKLHPPGPLVRRLSPGAGSDQRAVAPRTYGRRNLG
jgi:hypothetical protein